MTEPTIPLTEAVSRLLEIETGTDDAQAAIVAALLAAGPEEIGRAVLIVARDRIAARAAAAAAERDAAQATLGAMRSSRDAGGPLH